MSQDLQFQALLKRAREDDEAAFAEIVAPHVDGLLRFANKNLPRDVCGDTSDEDMVQEALLDAFRYRQNLRCESPVLLRALLFTILRNVIGEEIRKKRNLTRNVRRNQPLNDGTCQPIEGWLQAKQTSPTEEARRPESWQAFHRDLARLPKDERDVITLFHDGHGLGEIADILETSRRHVARLFSQGLARLEKWRLQREGGVGDND